jgi:hypothetical protein
MSMKRFLVFALLFVPLLGLSSADAGKKKKGDDPKEALQALQEFIGSWKGSGTSQKNRSEVWKESASWSWKFKGADTYLTVDFKGGKYFTAGEVRYLPEKGKYQVTLTDKKGARPTFEGEIKKNVLVLERTNPATRDTEQIKMNTAGGGDRLVYTYAIKPAGRTLYNKQFQVGYTKEGVTFGVAEGSKKPECVVTGGLGTMTVSYMGATYYVCCSGCRDAFNDNPAKIIAEYKARKKAGR